MAGLRVEVVVEGGLLVVVGIGVGALGAVAGRVRDLDKGHRRSSRINLGKILGSPKIVKKELYE